MAINFLNTVDLNQNQLIKAAIQNLAANPASGVEGQIYFNTVAQTIKVYKEILPSTSPKTYEWASISGDITEVQGGTYINVTNQTGPIPIVNHDTTTRTNNSSAVSPAYGATFTALDSITTNTTGHVTEVNTKTVTLPASVNTTYDLTTGPAGTTTIRLTDSDSVNDDVTISGTTGQTAISRIDASELRVKLTDSVTISNNLTLTSGNLTLTSGNLSVAGTGSFTGEVTVPTATVGTSAPNLAQVELLVAGVGVFQGSYNADTNTPALEGGSNVALDQGDYFVVSVSGSFLGEALEPGDFIFANNSIAANSSPALSNYTVVQADDNIAGAGATDGATQKGVSGFDSASFTVSSNGWVKLKPQANPYGATVALTGGVDSGGETTFTVNVVSLFGTGALAANCKAEVVTTSGRQTVYPDITGNGTGSLDFKFIPVVADSVYSALITIV
tara:strand:+ start:910 stop:2247 length:1338 start_codon:yes stop_codon:yes gene_type:complete